VGLVLGLIFLFGLGLSIAAMIVTISFQRKLKRANRGSSWAQFLAISIVLAILIGWLGTGVWPEGGDGAPSGQDYNFWALSTFLVSLAPGIGFILAYIYSRKK
jgi:hypothetical protein